MNQQVEQFFCCRHPRVVRGIRTGSHRIITRGSNQRSRRQGKIWKILEVKGHHPWRARHHWLSTGWSRDCCDVSFPSWAAQAWTIRPMGARYWQVPGDGGRINKEATRVLERERKRSSSCCATWRSGQHSSTICQPVRTATRTRASWHWTRRTKWGRDVRVTFDLVFRHSKSLPFVTCRPAGIWQFFRWIFRYVVASGVLSAPTVCAWGSTLHLAAGGFIASDLIVAFGLGDVLHKSKR